MTMKRITLLILMIFAVAYGVQAQEKPKKIDKRVQEQISKPNASGNIHVIVQSIDGASLPAKLQHAEAKLTKTFQHFQGVAAEMPLRKVQELANDSSILMISSDEPVQSDALTGTEENANDASGGAVALKQYGAAGQGIGIAIIDSGIASHPDVKNVVYSADFTASPIKGDPFGHGTHVA